jgi:hypothetical protein
MKRADAVEREHGNAMGLHDLAPGQKLGPILAQFDFRATHRKFSYKRTIGCNTYPLGASP